MKSKWVIHKLNFHLPSWIISPFKTQIHSSLKTSTFILNHVDISFLLSICGKEGYFHLGTSIHASIIKNGELHNPLNRLSFQNPLVIWNSLLSMYSKCGVLIAAVKVFDDMPMRDTVSWNSMVSGFLRNGDFDMGFGLFKKMLKLNVSHLDKATLTTVLSACDRPELGFVGKMIHCLVFLNGFESEVTVGNALITAYFKCKCPSSAMRVFDEMVERNVITWTAVISGSAQNELYEDSLRLFSKMLHRFVEPNYLTYLSLLTACSGLQALREGCQIHARVWKLGIQSDLCIESALMDMYSKCGRVEDAWQIFESVSELDEVSVTVVLVGLAQNCLEEEAIQFFIRILKTGIQVDPNMVSAVLGVFGVDTSLGLGKQIHSLVIKRGFGSNPFVGNGLINMYSKCGDLEDSIKVFSRMSAKNNVSWNSMIAAFARHGDALGALQLFEEMRIQGVEPTDITFLSVLHACSHVGLVEKGMEYLNSMTEVHRISPRTEHYACVVDMLGRAGLLNEARTFIQGLPVKPDELIWQALLGASSFHGDTEIGKYAAEQLFLAAPATQSAVPYVLLANIYSSRGKWKERAMIIKRMKDMKVAKETGISWIEIDKRKHSFVVQDKMHPQADAIYGILRELFRHIVDEGYVPDKRFILYYLDQDEKGV